MCDTKNDAITATSSSTKSTPVNIATISSGFEKGDFLVREEKGQRVYFDFLEEAFNYVREIFCSLADIIMIHLNLLSN